MRPGSVLSRSRSSRYRRRFASMLSRLPLLQGTHSPSFRMALLTRTITPHLVHATLFMSDALGLTPPLRSARRLLRASFLGRLASADHQWLFRKGTLTPSNTGQPLKLSIHDNRCDSPPRLLTHRRSDSTRYCFATRSQIPSEALDANESSLPSKLQLPRTSPDSQTLQIYSR